MRERERESKRRGVERHTLASKLDLSDGRGARTDQEEERACGQPRRQRQHRKRQEYRVVQLDPNVGEKRWEREAADLLGGALQAGVVVDHSPNVGGTQCCL